MKTVRPGIRLKDSGRYYATKSIDGQRYFKEFNTLREAEIWKNKFHPLIHKDVKTQFISPTRSSANDFVNGRDKLITVKEVLEKYSKGPMKSLGTYSRYNKPRSLNRFLPPIFSVRLCELTPEVITDLLHHAVASTPEESRRNNFREDLKHFKSLLNWYREEKDFSFVVPITKYHYRISEVRAKEDKKKFISIEELVHFMECLPDFERKLATVQFIYGLRIGEVCALTTDAVDFKNKKIKLSKTITWLKDTPSLKLTTKTEDVSELQMTEEVEMIFRELDAKRPSGCRYFFHHKGKMPMYRRIFNNYNQALKDAGIESVSGTHFIRHTAATISRKFGGIDAAQALMRHKSSAMSEHYAKLDVKEKSSEVVINAQKVFLEARASNASMQSALSKVSEG